MRPHIYIGLCFLFPGIVGLGTLAASSPASPAVARPAHLRARCAAHRGGVKNADEPASGSVTSLIVDAKEFDVQRSMAPKVLRQDGSEVWGTKSVDPDYVIDSGIVVYAHSLDEARKNKRAGQSPLVIKAIGKGKNADDSDVVVGDDDAKQILDENHKSHYLDHNNVIFVINK